LSIVFEPSNDDTKELLSTEITSAITFWLPYIIIENLEILNVEDDSSLLHTIKITLTFSVDGFSTDKITIIANEDSSTITIE